MAEFEPRSYVISGEVPTEDWEVCLQVLGRLGIDIRPIDGAFGSQPQGSSEQSASELCMGEIPYTLAKIASRDQYLSDEHLDEFWPIYRSNLEEQGDKRVEWAPGMALGLSPLTMPDRRDRISDLSTTQRVQYAKELGLEVVHPRSKVGFSDQLMFNCSGQYWYSSPAVVRVGSFIDFMADVVNIEPAARPRFINDPKVCLFGALATHLKLQIESAEAA